MLSGGGAEGGLGLDGEREGGGAAFGGFGGVAGWFFVEGVEVGGGGLDAGNEGFAE